MLNKEKPKLKKLIVNKQPVFKEYGRKDENKRMTVGQVLENKWLQKFINNKLIFDIGFPI